MIISLWIIGLILLTSASYAEGDFHSWAVTAVIGMAFTVVMYFIRRFVNTLDDLADNVKALSIESTKSREWRKSVEKDISILTKRANKMTDWRNKHQIVHASCPECPAEQ